QIFQYRRFALPRIGENNVEGIERSTELRKSGISFQQRTDTPVAIGSGIFVAARQEAAVPEACLRLIFARQLPGDSDEIVVDLNTARIEPKQVGHYRNNTCRRPELEQARIRPAQFKQLMKHDVIVGS